jgi:hypothetical protein
MGKITGVFLGAAWSRFFLATLIFLASVLSQESAFACRGIRNWSTGDDLAKIKPGEVVVKAKLIRSFKNEERSASIMGIAFGMIYYVEITEIVGGASTAKVEIERDDDGKIYIRLKPSVCEAYYPRDFSKTSSKTLVLQKGDTGLFDLVGGQG